MATLDHANQDALNSRMIDVDGDGRADLVVASAIGLLVFRSDGLDGYKAPEVVARAAREADGPVLLFANAQESLLLADMTGDGLIDLVRVRHNGVCYWPNLGYGRFGRHVQMASAPVLDRPDHFDARRGESPLHPDRNYLGISLNIPRHPHRGGLSG